MAKKFPSFTFQRFTFEPLRQLNEAEKCDHGPHSALLNYSNQIRETRPVLNSRERGWDYAKFYAAAKQVGAGEIDLFLVKGRGDTLYLPTSAYLAILPPVE